MNAIVPKELLTATLGGLSLLVVSGGTDRQVLTQQADGTYAPEAVSAGIGGSVGSKDNRLVRSDGTGGSTVQSTGITVDDSNNVSGIGTFSSGVITASGLSCLTTNSIISLGYNSYIRWLNSSASPVTIIQLFNDDVYIDGMGGSGNDIFLRANGNSIQILGLNNYVGVGISPTERLHVAGNILATGTICAGTYTVGTLPSAAASAYKFATVSDSSVTTFGSTVAGGGSSKVMVFSNGTNWTVCAA